MNPTSYNLMAFAAGVLLAAQAGYNSRLGVLANDALLASTVALLTASICIGGLYLASARQLPKPSQLAEVPPYLWVIGGMLSALAVSTVYWLVPKLGISTVIVLAVAGQLLTSLIAGHFGWFGLPRTALTPINICGAVALLASAVLVNHGK